MNNKDEELKIATVLECYTARINKTNDFTVTHQIRYKERVWIVQGGYLREVSDDNVLVKHSPECIAAGYDRAYIYCSIHENTVAIIDVRGPRAGTITKYDIEKDDSGKYILNNPKIVWRM